MPLALEYGMTPDDFWFEDIRLFVAYAKAHRNKVHYAAWLHGARVQEAVSVALSRGFSKGSKAKYSDAPDFKPTIQKQLQQARPSQIDRDIMHQWKLKMHKEKEMTFLA